MTVTEARGLVKSDPGKYRAAVVWAPETPLLDHPQARASLHATVKAAHAEYRARKESLEKSGWKLAQGSLGKKVMVFERAGEKIALGLDKRQTRRG